MKNRTLITTPKSIRIQNHLHNMDMCSVMTVCMNMVLFSMHCDT